MSNAALGGTRGEAFREGRPVWDVALLFPNQGAWTVDDYLSLGTNRLVEFDNGFVEILPMPTLLHQLIVKVLFTKLDQFVSQHATGNVLFAPLPVQLWEGKFREPDIAYFRPSRLRDLGGQPQGADLAVEVVSEGPDNRRRDLEIKPREYAKAGIHEYWIVDPEERQITILCLHGDSYREHGVFRAGQIASSVLLTGFHMAVDEIFSVAADGEQ